MTARFPTTRESAVLGALSGGRDRRRGSWDRLARAYYPPVEAIAVDEEEL